MASDVVHIEKKASFESLDRISTLPIEIIDEIFQFMPIREAVKTSWLSRSWRYKWMSMPNLVFDPQFIDLVNFVNNILRLHNGMISKFEVNEFVEKECPYVDEWILVLQRKNVKHLVLKFNEYRSPVYDVPTCLFSCQTLCKLKLQGCILNLPTQYKGFRNLTDLELVFVTITNQSFENLVAKIPLLRRLSIWNCESLTCFNISAPNLKTVRLCGVFESINWRNTPNVGIATLATRRPSGSGPTTIVCKLDDVLGGLSGVRCMVIRHPFLEFLSMDTAPKRLAIDFDLLRYLKLFVNFQDMKQIVAVLCLCRSSPRLEVLDITVVWSGQSLLLYEKTFWEALLQKEKKIFGRLEYVVLVGFMGGQRELQFIQFVLQNSSMLKTFKIQWTKPALSQDEKLHAVEKMMQFERSSAKAKVIFSNRI